MHINFLETKLFEFEFFYLKIAYKSEIKICATFREILNRAQKGITVHLRQ